MDRYKYSVTPFSPIRDLIPGKSIRAPFTADLDKDEVFLCMKHGPVYRLFPGKNPIKVTGSNFESLHKSKYEEVVEEVKAEQSVYVEPEPEVVEEVPVEEKLETVDEPNSFEEDINIFDSEEIREEVRVETPVQEEPVEEEYVEPEAEEDVCEEEVPVEESYEPEEEYTEDVEEEEESVEETPVAESQNTQQPHTPQFKPNYSKKKKNKNRH